MEGVHLDKEPASEILTSVPPMTSLPLNPWVSGSLLEKWRKQGLCHKDAVRIRLIQVIYKKSGLLESFSKCKTREREKVK